MHILNGDETLKKFEKSNISGGILVWREILSEGPVISDLSSPEFWETRKNYLCSESNVTPEEYEAKTIAELNKLDNINEHNEIVLWFEHDLVCQINLIFLISYLQTKNYSNKLSVINIDNFYKPGFKGIGELNPEDYKTLYEKRIELSKEDIETAKHVWGIYSDKNPLLLNDISKINFSNLKYLKSALENHKHRFPSVENGLNKIQSDILKIIAEKQQSEKQLMNEIVGNYLKSDYVYGIGDLQVISYIKHLSPKVIEIIDNFVSVTDTGMKVMNNELDLFDVMPDAILKENNYRYNSQNNLIEKH